jgi:hypothetical protein
MRRVEKLLFGWLVAFLVGVTGLIAYVLIEHATRCSRFEFRASEWRDKNADRNEIAHRLVECHRLNGLDDGDVLAQLGKPQEMFEVKRHPGVVRLSYDAGSRETYAFPTAETLDVVLSPAHRVQRARISGQGD